MFLPFEVPALSNLVTSKLQVQKLSEKHTHKQHDLVGLLADFINSFNYKVTKDFSKKPTRLKKEISSLCVPLVNSYYKDCLFNTFLIPASLLHHAVDSPLY